MKKLFLMLMMVMMFPLLAKADAISLTDEVKKIPELKQGVAFSLVENKINYLSTIEVARWNKLSLEAGYAGDAENTGHKAVAVLSIDLLNLQNIIKFPILDKIVFRPGIWAGYGNINFKEVKESEFDWGISASLISLRF